MQNIEKNLITELLQSDIKTSKDLISFKNNFAKKHKTSPLPNSALLKVYHKLPEKQRNNLRQLKKLLVKRPTRSASGIVNVSVLTKPWPCFGKCIYCPSQKNTPKSYLAKEPLVQRAVLNQYHPFKQTQMRLQALYNIGHNIDKVELRVVGGTWNYYPKRYRNWFIKECYRACNEFCLRAAPLHKCRGAAPLHKCRRVAPLRLQKENEKAKCRVVGLSIETRPDCITKNEIKHLRELGITKVELGVQTLYNEVLKINKRGHLVSATIKATKILKDAGFKVSYQVMPNLLGSSPKNDLSMFKELFSNPAFKPDAIKIYPLALIKETSLYKYYQKKQYQPYTKNQLVKLLAEIKKQIPYWCRVERIIRDIPKEYIVGGGAKQSNLRQEVAALLKKQNTACHCIRCREVGLNYIAKEKIYLFQEKYTASGGTEIFLSYENKNRSKLFALLRLRLNKETAIVRELHTFGMALEIGGEQTPAKSAQHKGLGKKLLKKAEYITKKAGINKLSVISAVGARPYYRKLGYKLKNTYLVKIIK